jgi:hypothetical protein
MVVFRSGSALRDLSTKRTQQLRGSAPRHRTRSSHHRAPVRRSSQPQKSHDSLGPKDPTGRPPKFDRPERSDTELRILSSRIVRVTDATPCGRECAIEGRVFAALGEPEQFGAVAPCPIPRRIGNMGCPNVLSFRHTRGIAPWPSRRGQPMAQEEGKTRFLADSAVTCGGYWPRGPRHPLEAVVGSVLVCVTHRRHVKGGVD